MLVASVTICAVASNVNALSRAVSPCLIIPTSAVSVALLSNAITTPARTFASTASVLFVFMSTR